MAFNVKANKKMIKRNRYTLIPILIILGMLFILKSRIPMKEVRYTEQVTYNNMKYIYQEVIKANPFQFVRAGSVEEGKLVLLKRGDKKDITPETIYIYGGNKKYLRYTINQ